jgi:transcriptional regulator with XRE-family HTH domain
MLTVGEMERRLLILGETVRGLREERGLSVAELSAATGVEEEQIVVLEEGRLDPDYDMLLTLAEGVGVPDTAFYVGTEREDLRIVGAAFRKVREEHGLSVGGLASASGYSEARITAVEEGRRDPDYVMVVRLAKSIGVPSATFVLRAEEMGAWSAEEGA